MLRSPSATHSDLKELKNFFNLTMTYRMDSDIKWDYGKVYDKETNEFVAPFASPKWREIDNDFFGRKIIFIKI